MRICNRCGNEVYESTIPDYAYECDVCDESLYSFETNEVKILEVDDSASDKDVRRAIDGAITLRCYKCASMNTSVTILTIDSGGTDYEYHCEHCGFDGKSGYFF